MILQTSQTQQISKGRVRTRNKEDQQHVKVSQIYYRYVYYVANEFKNSPGGFKELNSYLKYLCIAFLKSPKHHE